MKKLLRYSDNWADEMDLDSFAIVDEKDDIYKNYLKASEYADNVENEDEEDSLCICVGSNEEVYYDSVSALLNAIEVTDITDEEAKVISKYLGEDYGEPSLEYVLECAVENISCEE